MSHIRDGGYVQGYNKWCTLAELWPQQCYVSGRSLWSVMFVGLYLENEKGGMGEWEITQIS